MTKNLFEVDKESRIIAGLCVPYGEPTFSEGSQFQFSKGSLEIPENSSRIKLLVSHERNRAVGHAVEFEDTDEGLWARFKVARGAAGDEALSMAEDGVWDGLSVGLRDGAKFSKKGKISHFTRAVLSEVSLTPDPAFDSARVAAVIAEAPNNNGKEPSMANETNEDAVVAPFEFDYNKFAKAISDNTPKPVNPATAFGFEVNESGPYKFDASRNVFEAGDHEFSTDLFDGLKGDRDAYGRAIDFVKSQFAVTQTNVSANNPNGQRPDLYVARRDYKFPLWDAVKKGTLNDNIPFVFPRFNSATGLVADHTEGVEPTPGGFTATSQTVTPKAMSGKVEITREVFDAGGNPQVSNLIWSEMVRGYNEALEASVVTELTAQAANITDIALTTAGGNAALVAEILAAFADLQYQRGGFRFQFLATQVDLYKKLVAASGSDGRQLLPYFNPTNSSGSSAAALASLNIQGVEAIPSWALAGTGSVSANSWLIDPSAVHGWASAPTKLTFEYRVALIDLAIWGYRAVAVSDYAGVRQVTYDPV